MMRVQRGFVFNIAWKDELFLLTDQAEQEQIKKDCEKVESRLKESFSEETIKNNNAHPPEKNELHSSSEVIRLCFD